MVGLNPRIGIAARDAISRIDKGVEVGYEVSHEAIDFFSIGFATVSLMTR